MSQAQTAAQLNPEGKRWVGEQILMGAPRDAVLNALVRNGIPIDVAAREYDAALSSPYLGASNRLVSRLRKRDWHLSVLADHWRQSPTARDVPTIHQIEPDHFYRDFYFGHRPVKLTGLLAGSPALDVWSLDYFSEKVGEALVEVQAERDRNVRYELEKDKHRKTMKMAAFIDLLRSDTPNNTVYLTAANTDVNRRALAPLWEDIGPMPGLLDPEGDSDGFLWLGPKGTRTPLHHDLTNNLLVQVFGEKRVRIAPGFEVGKMANSVHCFSDRDADTVPLRSDAPTDPWLVDVTLGPGEGLFIPVGWWHHVDGLSLSASLTFTNFLYSNDFSGAYDTSTPM